MIIDAPVFRRLSGRLLNDKELRARFAGLGDQAFFSMATLAQTFVYARALSKPDFGYFAIVLSICVLCQSIQRAILILPMIVSAQRHYGGIDRIWRTVSRYLFVAPFVLGCAGAAVCLFAVHGPQVSQAILLSGICISGYLWFDFSRRCCFMSGYFERALIASAIYFLLVVASLVAISFLAANFVIATIAFAASILLAAIVANSFVPVRDGESQSLRSIVDEHYSTALWNLASLVPYTAYTSLMPSFIAILHGPAASAVFSATRVIVAPITMLLSAVDNVDKPRAGRALASGGRKALFESLHRTALSLVKMGLPYLALVAFAPGLMLRLSLGKTYAHEVHVAQGWALIGLLMLFSQPLESGLVIMRRSHSNLVSRSVAAACVGIVMSIPWAGAPAMQAVVAVCIAWLASDMAALFMTARASRIDKAQHSG